MTAMKDAAEKKKLSKKLQGTFLNVVRKGLNDEEALERVSDVQEKYPGITQNELADILIKRAWRRTALAGACSGLGITGCEAALVTPAPEPIHKVAAGTGIGAMIVTDLTHATAVQMRLLQELGHLYECPFDSEDEEDFWLVYRAAQGVKGVEQASDYVRFIFVEAAKKNFRKLLRTGIRRGVQQQVIAIAGKRAGKLVAEKSLMKLVPLANIGIGFAFNRWLTKRVGKWGKVRARIRSGMFKLLRELRQHDPDAAQLILPIILHVGTSSNKLTDNTLSLYAQTAKRLNLSDEEIAAMEHVNEDSELEEVIAKNKDQLKDESLRLLLLEAGVITAASSRLKFVAEHNDCLKSLGECLDVPYTESNLKEKIKAFLGS